MRQEILRMERVTYREHGVMLLEDFNLQIRSGEIMGLLPINSHGLGTFLRLLQNNLPLYDGYVYYGDELVNSWRGAKKAANRISVISAQSRLVEGISVLDNIFVLRQGFRQEIIHTNILKRQLAPFLEDVGIDIPVEARVEELSAFERVIVELLRAVALGHRLIVLYEIGAVIGCEEMEKLHEILLHYTKQGFSFLYVCLHYEEIGSVCDRAALLFNGRIQKIVRQRQHAEETVRLYTDEFVGMVQGHLARIGMNGAEKREVLRFDGISGELVHNLSFSVYEGECLVVQTLDNRTFQEIKALLVGDLRVRSGRILMEGRRAGLTDNSGIAVIQELPTQTMIFPGLSYMENLCISLAQRMPSIWMQRRIRSSIRQEYVEVLGNEVFSMHVEQLSEKQRYQLIYARILLQKPRVVFCIQPFKGADLPHRMAIWEMMELLLKHGIAVVILSLNLADSLSLADRLLVLDRDGAEDEIWRKDFASISAAAPWLHLYREPEE